MSKFTPTKRFESLYTLRVLASSLPERILLRITSALQYVFRRNAYSQLSPKKRTLVRRASRHLMLRGFFSIFLRCSRIHNSLDASCTDLIVSDRTLHKVGMHLSKDSQVMARGFHGFPVNI